LVAQDRHDRDAGAAARLGVGDPAAGVRGASGDRQPVDGQALDLLLQLGERLGDARAAEQPAQRLALRSRELHHLLGGVGVVLVVEDEVTPAGAVRHHAELAAAAGGEVMAEPDPGQRGLVDLDLLLRRPVRLMAGRAQSRWVPPWPLGRRAAAHWNPACSS